MKYAFIFTAWPLFFGESAHGRNSVEGLFGSRSRPNVSENT